MVVKVFALLVTSGVTSGVWACRAGGFAFLVGIFVSSRNMFWDWFEFYSFVLPSMVFWGQQQQICRVADGCRSYPF